MLHMVGIHSTVGKRAKNNARYYNRDYCFSVVTLLNVIEVVGLQLVLRTAVEPVLIITPKLPFIFFHYMHLNYNRIEYCIFVTPFFG